MGFQKAHAPPFDPKSLRADTCAALRKQASTRKPWFSKEHAQGRGLHGLIFLHKTTLSAAKQTNENLSV